MASIPRLKALGGCQEQIRLCKCLRANLSNTFAIVGPISRIHVQELEFKAYVNLEPKPKPYAAVGIEIL